MDRALQILSGILMIVLTAIGTLAINTGVQTNNQLHRLTEAVSALTNRMVILENRVDGLPPKDLQLRIRLLEEWREDLEEEKVGR